MVRALTGSRAVHDLVFGLERRLVDAATLVFATSAEERLKFQVLYGAGPDRIALCPNGVAEAEFAWAAAPGAFRSRERRPADRLTALFFGSDHPPNVQAGRFILDRLAPAFPATDFVIAGSVCAALGPPASGNLTLLGPLDAEAKHEILRAADLFLNPIAEGAGTSLKVLEAMAAGLPVLSTEAGIRGLDLADGEVVAVDTLARFPRRLVALLARPELRSQMGLAAHAIVEERFGWRHIAEAAGDRIARLLDTGRIAATSEAAARPGGQRLSGRPADRRRRAADPPPARGGRPAAGRRPCSASAAARRSRSSPWPLASTNSASRGPPSMPR